MAVPDSLGHKIELFRETGGIFPTAQDIFHLTSWLQVLWGQGIRPRGAHPFVQAVAPSDRTEYLKNIRELMAQAASALPGHGEFIARHSAAPAPAR
jgi:tryptophan halogenase